MALENINIAIGSGNRPIDGFLNFDIFPRENILYGKADNLSQFSNKSVDILFSNAVFEHIEVSNYDTCFKEWKRILKNDGLIIFLGIPDFKEISNLYINDLLSEEDVYNYAIGQIEDTKNIELLKAQMHKKLFNKFSLKNIFSKNGFESIVFNYCYPNENYFVNLGIIASIFGVLDVEKSLKKIPSILDYVDIKKIKEFI